MNPQDPRKYAIYSRKSKFTGKGESIENQVEMCRQQLAAWGYAEEQILVFEDEGFSGGNTQRPQFKAMMEGVKAGKIGGVICYRLDRISRNVLDFATILNEFERKEVEFTSLRDNFETRTPGGRAMLMMASVFAQLERETIAERIRDNMYELAKTGRWLGGNTPTGYRSVQITGSVTVDGRERKAYKLEVIPEEADTVRLIFRKFLETRSLTAVDAFLLEQGIKTKLGKPFARYAIQNILRNPVYLIADEAGWCYFDSRGIDLFADRLEFDGTHGVMAYNKTKQQSGKHSQTRKLEDWIIAVGKHPGLISGEDWVKAQELLDENRSKAFRRPRSHRALLSGLLVCGNCGGYMRPKLTQRTTKDGEPLFTYMCETKERSKRAACNQKNLNGNELDNALCEQLAHLSEDEGEFQRQLDKIEAALAKEQGGVNGQLQRLEKDLRETEKKISNLVLNLAETEDQKTARYITRQIEELDGEKERIAQRMQEIARITEGTDTDNADFVLLRDRLQNFGKAFERMGIDQRRMLLRVFVRKIVWDGENVHVFLFGSEDDPLPNVPLSEGSKRNPHALSGGEEIGPGRVPERAH